jgi:hypothetical protein
LFYNGTGIYPVQREYYRPTYSSSFLTGVTQTLSKDLINYAFAVSRGHNIGSLIFPKFQFHPWSNEKQASTSTLPRTLSRRTLRWDELNPTGSRFLQQPGKGEINDWRDIECQQL